MSQGNVVSFEGRVRGALHVPVETPAPCVVIAHGFKGFMGWGMFPWIADKLAAAGFAAVRFDFSLNGADENGDFTRLDEFRQNTLTHEQQDLAWLLDAIANGEAPFGGRCRPDRIGLLGHSRGGAGAILCAAQDARVGAVATLGAIAVPTRFPDEARAEAEARGFFEVPNARTGQQMPVGVEFFRDVENHDILASAAALEQSVLIVHGTEDQSVPVEDGRALRKAAQDRALLVEVKGAGHTFGAVHPFAGPTPELEHAFAAVAAFFSDRLV